MIEIIIPDIKEKFYLSPGEKTSVKRVKEIISNKTGWPQIMGMYVIDMDTLTVFCDDHLVRDVIKNPDARLLLC